ncbi:hypothetical protein [Aestuariispira insulae]|uniref:Uncharacterized protein n=1 Tax=Aestuariispira insulae TaxID=1461337 RepID=A0A3D9H2K0_9PROT|nr:hypothetical protein [Aestuariispira insulae]RED43729.1 hypothetical protein DFP90_12013 [Aestuariispira insulae]
MTTATESTLDNFAIQLGGYGSGDGNSSTMKVAGFNVETSHPKMAEALNNLQLEVEKKVASAQKSAADAKGEGGEQSGGLLDGMSGMMMSNLAAPILGGAAFMLNDDIRGAGFGLAKSLAEEVPIVGGALSGAVGAAEDVADTVAGGISDAAGAVAGALTGGC